MVPSVMRISLYITLFLASTMFPSVMDTTLESRPDIFGENEFQDLVLSGDLDYDAVQKEIADIKNDRYAPGTFEIDSHVVEVQIRRTQRYGFEAKVSTLSLTVYAKLQLRDKFKDIFIEQRLVFDQFEPAYTPNLEFGMFTGKCRVTLERYKRTKNYAKYNEAPKEERKSDQYSTSWKLNTELSRNSFIFEVPNGLPSGLIGRSYYWHDIPYKLHRDY